MAQDIRKKFIHYIALSLACLLAHPLMGQETPPADLLPKARIFLHSPMGIRLEYNLDKAVMELWLSPAAGKETSYYTRAFSNRYDHMRLFDKIEFPDLNSQNFIKSEYDPFYTKLFFKEQILHIRMLYDRPGVVAWLEKGGNVNFKSDKADSLLMNTENRFGVYHPDRWEEFHFIAAIGEGGGEFGHMLNYDKGRSIYGQARLKAGQPIFIVGERTKEPVQKIANDLVMTSLDSLHKQQEALIEKAMQTGDIQLKNEPRLQKFLDTNRRVLLSMQDHSGALRAALIDYYYLIWARDGAIIFNPWAWAGNLDALTKWNDFLFDNPTIVEGEEPEGKMYGQLVSGPITKWQTDGNFFAILNAFTEWTQSGDTGFVDKERLQLLREVMTWWEKRDYNKEKGLFGRYYVVETPTHESRGHGYDNADGNPGAYWAKYAVKHQDHKVTRAYDQYINRFAYNAYIMLSVMTEGEEADKWFAKAAALGENMKVWSKDDEIPYFGNFSTTEGKWLDIKVEDIYVGVFTDYLWGVAMSDLQPDLAALQTIRQGLLNNWAKRTGDTFLAGLFMLTASMDPMFSDQEQLMQIVKESASVSYPPGKMLPMADAMKEMLRAKDGDEYHDARPQAFSIGPFLATVTGQGIRRMPFGLAFRSNTLLNQVTNYQWMGKKLDISFEDEGTIKQLVVNGKIVKGSLQLPDNLLETKEKNITVKVVQVENSTLPQGTLVSSTIRLHSVKGKKYEVEGYGLNHVAFFGDVNPVILDQTKSQIQFEKQVTDGFTWIKFEGKGVYLIKL